MWRFRSLRMQLTLVFLGFLLLVSGSVAATLFAIRAQTADATVINLAGRQRMLTQKMVWLALNEPHTRELDTSMRQFEDTLRVLRDGGPARSTTGRRVRLPPAPTAALRAQLDEVTLTWRDFRAALRSGDTTAIKRSSRFILTQLDAIVGAFEAYARAKVFRLQVLQAGFFLAALLLVGWSYLLTRRQILQPLVALVATARRMASRNLSDPVSRPRDNELGELARTFEALWGEILDAQSRLESRVAQRTRELVSAFELSQEIVAQLELDRLLHSVTERARTLGHARAAALCLLKEEDDALCLVATSGANTSLAGVRQSLERQPARQVVGDGRTVVTSASSSTCAFLDAHAPGACAAMPLRAGGALLGSLCVVREVDRPLDADETRALTLLANAAAIAITNARLVEASRRQAEEAATLAERERLAAELHDNLAQTLSFLNIKTDRLRELGAGQGGWNSAGGGTASQGDEFEAELDRMQAAIEDAYGQVRVALTGLRAGGSAPADDLAEKLTAVVAEFRETAGLPTSLALPDSTNAPRSKSATLPLLPPVVRKQVIYIVREALSNVRRHAQAEHVQVRVEHRNDELYFTVEDDGRGFDVSTVDQEKHLGLTIMRTRAERSGGHLEVASAPGQGTQVVARFPLRTGDVNPASPAGEEGEA